MGKIYTAFGLALDLGIVLGTIVFNGIYKATLETYSGSVFLVAAGLQVRLKFVHLVLAKRDCGELHIPVRFNNSDALDSLGRQRRWKGGKKAVVLALTCLHWVRDETASEC